MPYTKQTWVDLNLAYPPSAERFAHMEDGISNAGPVYMVAAADAPARLRAQADYVCDGVADDVELNAAITAAIATGGVVRLTQGTFNMTAALDFSALKGTNRGFTFMGAGSGNLFTTTRAATLIKNSNAGPAIKAYGTLAGATATPIVSLNLQGFMIENQVNIGASNWTIDVDYCVNGMVWWDIFVAGGNLGGNGIRTLNTANGGFVMQYVVCRGFRTGVGHYDAAQVTANVDVAPNSGNGVKIGCQSVDCLVHFRTGAAAGESGNLFNSTSFISCKAVNVTDVPGSIGLDIRPHAFQTFVASFHSEFNAYGIQDWTRGSTVQSAMCTYIGSTPASTTGSVASASTALTVADGQFWANGDRIVVYGAGVAGANLITTVASGGGTTAITLTAPASTTVVNAKVGGVEASLRFLNGSWGGEYRATRVHGVAYGVRYEAGARGHQVSLWDAGITVGTVTGADQLANETQIAGQFGRTGISSQAKRDEAKRAALRIITQTFEKDFCTATYTATSQLLQGQSVGLCAGEVVTGIAVELTNTPTLLTLVKVGLCDKNGVRLAISADQSAGWMAAGAVHKDVAFTGAYTVLKDDLYYLEILVVGTGTMPTLIRSGAVSGVGTNPTNGGNRPFFGQAGQADIPATATLGAGQGGIWLAAY